MCICCTSLLRGVLFVVDTVDEAHVGVDVQLNDKEHADDAMVFQRKRNAARGAAMASLMPFKY